MHYETVAAACRDLEQVSSRLALIDRLAELLRQTPAGLLPRVVYLCLGEIAPAFAGIDIGMADKMVTRALADHTGVPLDEVRVVLRETGDLGLTAEQLLAGHRAADRVFYCWCRSCDWTGTVVQVDRHIGHEASD